MTRKITDQQRFLDDFKGREAGIHRGHCILKHHLDASAKSGQVSIMQLSDVCAANQNLSGIWPFETRNASRHGGFSRSRLSDQRQRLPARDLKIDVAYGGDGYAFPPQTAPDVFLGESFYDQQVLD
jgi:hypothetical protein